MTGQKLRTALTAPVVVPLLLAGLMLVAVAAMLVGLAVLIEGTRVRRAPPVRDRPTPRARVRPPAPVIPAGSGGPLQ